MYRFHLNAYIVMEKMSMLLTLLLLTWCRMLKFIIYHVLEIFIFDNKKVLGCSETCVLESNNPT